MRQYCISIKILDCYIQGSKKVNYFEIHDDCFYKEILILSVKHKKEIYYLFVIHNRSHYDFFDPDEICNEKNNELSREEVTKNIADDLVHKIMSSSVYRSLEELSDAVRDDSELDNDFRNKLLSKLGDKNIGPDGAKKR